MPFVFSVMNGNGIVSSFTIFEISYGPFTFQLLSSPIEIAFVGQLNEQQTQSAQLCPIRILSSTSCMLLSGQFRTHFIQRIHFFASTFMCGPCRIAYSHSMRKIELHMLSHG